MADAEKPRTWRELTREEWDQFWLEHDGKEIEQLASAAVDCCGAEDDRPEMFYEIFADDVRMDLTTNTLVPGWYWVVEISEDLEGYAPDDYLGYTLDIRRVAAMLTPDQAGYSHSIASSHNELPPHVELSGLYQGQYVSLCFYLTPSIETLPKSSPVRQVLRMPKYDNPN